MPTSASALRAPRGTRDLTGETARAWTWLEATFRALATRAGYGEVRTPVFEATELFVRGVGEGSEIVGKEMYTFLDRKGRSLSLRPEGTAPVVRAVLEGGLLTAGAVTKLFYVGPMFRYDRPQAGRYRQFHQVGVEVFGTDQAYADAEVIAVSVDMLGAFGLSQPEVLVNSVGDAACRPAYEERIRAVLAPRAQELCPDCRARLATRPLRVLDCKVPGCADVARSVPPPRESLCRPCADHFQAVLGLLRTLGLRFRIADELVRGLDYYTRTVFEVHHASLGAQSALFGGGRYDGLVEQLGGPSTPAVGFAAGIERMLLAVEAEGAAPWGVQSPEISVVTVKDDARPAALKLARDLRKYWAVDVDLSRRSFAAQMKWANARNALYAFIVGPHELQREWVKVKAMRSPAFGNTLQAQNQKSVDLYDLKRLLLTQPPPPAGESEAELVKRIQWLRDVESEGPAGDETPPELVT